jgi:predicted RecA/RadA family phage recombinase
MATNIKYPGPGVSLFLTVPAGTQSGDPVLVGTLPGVAVIDADSNDRATVKLPILFAAEVTAHAVDGSGPSAIAPGDALYFNGASTPPISKNAGGTRWGTALGALAADAEGLILAAPVV